MDTTSAATPILEESRPAGFRIRQLPVGESLQPCVATLMAVELDKTGPIPLSIAPHDSVMLSVQLARGADAIGAKAEHGRNTCVTGIRRWTGSFIGAGDCVSLFALLTPLGVVRILESQPLDGVPRLRASVADLLDAQLTRQLESAIALSPGLDAKLLTLARWLEQRALGQRRQSPAALRAGRAASRLCAEPGTPMAALADEQHVCRRQLERDFVHYLGTSPRHLSQVARVQWVSRKARGGASLADIAADCGFSDQAHMSRSIRQMTGLTPKRFISSQRTPMAAAFRIATGGQTVYL